MGELSCLCILPPQVSYQYFFFIHLQQTTIIINIFSEIEMTSTEELSNSIEEYNQQVSDMHISILLIGMNICYEINSMNKNI